MSIMGLLNQQQKQEIAKTYDPKSIEKDTYVFWMQAHSFESQPVEGRESFCVMMPPPNVTGILHIGHVLNNTLQDVFVRRARQEGKNVLWLPGTDHAGIATQVRVENDLKKRGIERAQLGREGFVQEASRWRDQYGDIILEQLKRLGISADWSRKVHTLDADYSHAVLTAFVELYNRGYLYRGKRLVNWCPVSLTALSDEEVTMKVEKGFLYHMRYEVVECPGIYLEIATTRPETLMGDTAIAVHPDDERYQHLIGKHCWRPFPRAQIPIIGDQAVERSFGTGVLKVTPAHDAQDFEIGKRHQLPFIEVLNADGTLNALAGQPFAGMDRFKARKAVVEQLRAMGALVKEVPYEHSVGYSERADVPIEPRLSEQWFLRYPKVEEAKQVVREGIMKFWPEHWVKTYLHWLDNIQDWCVSRQLWWGHRLPVWYRKGADRHQTENIHVSVEGPQDREHWEQDEDVLDTWFSSWLWPFATLGWPNPKAMEQRHFKAYFPTDVLVTGPDILFFWAARMVMASFELIGGKEPLTEEAIKETLPFRHIYLTGIIRDHLGRKMSKSLGNSPDPLDLMDLYGADGLRWGLLAIAPMGQDILFSEDKIVQGRHFCNKVWNACRYRQMLSTGTHAKSFQGLIDALQASKLLTYDHEILNQLADLTDACAELLKEFEVFRLIQVLEAFFWNDLCDWYLEVSKMRAKKGTSDGMFEVMDLCLRQWLQLAHPVIPMMTEALWQQLGYGQGESIQRVEIVSGETLRNALKLDPVAKQHGALLKDFVTTVRSLKAQCQVAAKKGGVIYLQPKDEASRALIEQEAPLLIDWLGVDSIEKWSEEAAQLPSESALVGTIALKIEAQEVNGLERTRFEEELKAVERFIALNEQKLNNEQFVQKAPKVVLDGARKQLEENQKRKAELLQLLA